MKTSELSFNFKQSLDRKAIASFLQTNFSTNLARFNFNSKNLNVLNWEKQDQTKLLPQLKALQRLVRLTHDVDTAMALYEQGLHSAIQIASIPKHKFVKQYASLFTQNGPAEAQANQVHQRAVARKTRAVLTYTAIAQHAAPHYRATRFNNLSALTDNNYNSLPNYQELFGNLDFCSCDECRTIFSPAAYLVDLMRLQDQCISKDPAAQSTAPLLKERRPDLWEIPLDCEHTNTEVSKLQIVNEVLLQTLKPQPDYKSLATLNYPFNLPFHLPLTEIRQYLKQNKQTLAGIWKDLAPATDAASQRATACETLHLSPEQWTLYSTADVNTLVQRYGLKPGDDAVTILTPVNNFLAQTGLSYPQLEELVKEDLSAEEITQGLSAGFFINSVDAARPVALVPHTDGNDTLSNLTPKRLDRINRFVRLAQALKWSFTDLDWALRVIGKTLGSASLEINDNALQYLAWIQVQHKQYTLSIKQVCALIGPVKDFGRKNGNTFFEEIFNNTSVPNAPAWNDKGTYGLIWTVPQPANNNSIPAQLNLQIQNALTAALRISHDDLILVANEFLQACKFKDSRLPLTLENLSVLYRVSKLPGVTRLSLKACFAVLRLPGQPGNAVEKLFSSAAADVVAALRLLDQFVSWLQQAGFSIYQLQFITGTSGLSLDGAAQNQILGADKITNFLTTFQTIIQPTLFTREQFTAVVYPTVQNFCKKADINEPVKWQSDTIVSQLWEGIVMKNYVNDQGIILQAPTGDVISQTKAALVSDEILEVVADLISPTLQDRSEFQLQQKTLSQQLSGLYGTSPRHMYALMIWSGLTVGDINTASPDKGNNAASALLSKLLSAKNDNRLTAHLRIIQQYAVLLQSLALSPAESQAIADHPEYFDIAYTRGTQENPALQFNIYHIQTLHHFKRLVQSFQDTENHLLDYFALASSSTDINEIARRLADITQWNAGQILFLFNSLWPNAVSNKKATGDQPPYGTVAGLLKIQLYIFTARQLDLDIVTMWRLSHAGAAGDYDTYQGLADALWGGLQKQFHDQPGVLSEIQDRLAENKRRALLGLMIDQLTVRPDFVPTSRDIYEYLLIDVDVSGIIQTSYISEAISAVQLYIYRCLNHLEPGLEVDDELRTWWPWMEHYRVWQANREVFLYPENYIEPELRTQKSPEFEQLETNLNQANLTKEDQVISAFQTYMDGFATVANLQIIGSAIHDRASVSDGGDVWDQQKTLCLIGNTPTDPDSYYYRTAVLTPSNDSTTTGRYVPTQWTAWSSISLQLNPVGPVMPVYAFGKWFIFWIEQQQTGATDDAAKTPKYSAIIRYSYLNFSQSWVVPQTLANIALPNPPSAADPKPVDITKLTQDKPYWDRVYPVYFSSTKTIVVSYGKSTNDYLYYLSEGTLNTDDIAMAFRYTTAKSIDQGAKLLDKEFVSKSLWYKYSAAFGDKSLSAINEASLSTWFKLDFLPEKNKLTPIMNVTVAVNNRGQLTLNHIPATDVNSIRTGEWNHLVITVPKEQFIQLDIQTICRPAWVSFNNQIHLAWIDSSKQLHYGVLDDTGKVYDQQPLLEYSADNVAPGLAVYNGRLYITWNDVGHKISYGEVGGRNVLHKQTLLEEVSADLTPCPCIFVWKGKLRIAWINYTQVHCGELNGTNVVQNKQYIREGFPRPLTVVAWNDKLYIGWMTYPEFEMQYGELNENNTVQNLKTLKGITGRNFSLAVSNNKLYIWWISDSKLYQGELNGTDAVQNLREMRYSFPKDSNEQVSWISGSSPQKLLWFDESLNRASCTNPPACYINGKCIDSLSLNGDLQSPMYLGASPATATDGRTPFAGAFQETLLIKKVVRGTDVAAMYENSRGQITRDFDTTVQVNQGFKLLGTLSMPIVAQPNSYIIGHDPEFLVWPYTSSNAARLACWRLKSRAVEDLSKLLLTGDIDNLLTIQAQRTNEKLFSDLNPDSNIIPRTSWPSDSIDFFQGGMSMYYWEIFFHAPFLIARTLHNQQQFALAKKWYEYIFNPSISKSSWGLEIGEDVNDKYWRFLGLRSKYNPGLPQKPGAWTDQVQHDTHDEGQLAAYHSDPFDPHAIAQLRPIAYQKTMVMHYIDNLLVWGDNLFRQYTTETLVEAFMLYVTAYDLLGKQPVNTGACPLPAPHTLTEIVNRYGDIEHIPEFLIDLEQHLSDVSIATVRNTPHNYIPGNYFSLPENDQFLGYWKTVQQRIYNIRHNLNIDGIYQQLALFDPPINPMQLVAVAAGEEVGEVLAACQADIPYYRFTAMIAKAQAATQNVIQLGQALLSALEKKDAEQLSLLYNSNQQSLLTSTRVSKDYEKKAAEKNGEMLEASANNANDRWSYYNNLLSGGGGGIPEALVGGVFSDLLARGSGLSTGETAQLELEGAAIVAQTAAQIQKLISVPAYSIPTIFGLANGGFQPGDAVAQSANIMEGIAQAASMSSGLVGTIAGYMRRKQDWELQRTLAADDGGQVTAQIAVSDVQKLIAQNELDLVDKQIAQEKAVEQFLKNKFTRAQLYQWMVGKLSTLYFQAYQLAYSTSLQAEKAWQFERGTQQTFINPGYWTDLYHGLVAGEALQLDLQRMEKAYMDQDERKLEIEKTISLAQLAPNALQDLKATGTCNFGLIERDFDYDFRGHYCRQIKSVSLSFPALLGPYQNINATLTQTTNRTLLKPDENALKYLLGVQGVSKPDDKTILRVDVRANQQVALSQGANDDGLFVINFDDARYLPFEGTGAISNWKLEMPKDCNPINFDSLTDVIIQLKYTARSGGSDFAKIVTDNLGSFNGYQSLIMSQYPSAWYSFMQQGQPLVFSIGPNLFRRNLSGHQIIAITLGVLLTPEGAQKITKVPTLTLKQRSTDTAQDFTFVKDDKKPGIARTTVSDLAIDVLSSTDWQLDVKSDTDRELMTAVNISNVIMVLHYSAAFRKL